MRYADRMARLDLMGISEIALAIGVSPGRVHTIIKNDATFPEPAAELSVGRIWRTEDVGEWAQRAGYPKKKGTGA
jgi:hypothetical protein